MKKYMKKLFMYWREVKMAFVNLLLEKDNGLGILYVNRPKALNALNQETLLEMKDALTSISHDPEIDVLIITGSGDKAFVAGADIAFMQNLSAVEARKFGALGQTVFRMIETMEKPVIAAVNGFALGGGCELAMCCDFRIASTKAKFGQPEVGLGITPGFGGTQRLPRLIGAGMARQLLYTADIIDANEALRIGLVNNILPPEELMDNVKAIARKIMKKGKLAVRFCKAATNEGLQTDIDRAMTIEADLFGLCFSTEDQKEGMTAFVEKRAANFTGK
jgi:enoyl-CoA hydratase